MGGHAYLIYGKLAEHRLPAPGDATAPSAARPLWRRLLGLLPNAPRPEAQRVFTDPAGNRHFDIPPGPLRKQLAGDFKAFLREAIPSPSRGTKVMLDYLAVVDPSVYVRGDEEAGRPPEFYVQISFSGCAGMAEVSARLMSHWAAIWYERHRDRLTSQYLIPFGFTPSADVESHEERMAFLPAGELGYLEYLPAAAEPTGDTLFDLDGAVSEARPGDPLLDELDQRFAGYMADAKCRCQICDPGFGDAQPGH